MRLQSAIFDMDGTLLDSMPTWRELGPTFLKEAGISATPEQDRMLHILADCDVIPYLRKVCGLPWSQQEIIDQIIQRMETFYSSQVRPKPGLEKFLSILKMEGVWMYVATATDRHLAEAAEVFDEVEASPVMQDLWTAYQKKFSYASDLSWDTIMAAVRKLYASCEGKV